VKTRLLILTAIVVASAAVAVAVIISTSHTAKAEASGPPVTTGVPSVVPPEGVTLVPGVADITLMPIAAEANSFKVSSAEGAIALAPKEKTPLPPTAVLASVTIGATIAPPGESTKGYANIKDRPAWVVTFTYPEPIDVRVACAVETSASHAPYEPLLMSHDNIIIDAETGEFLWGFSTK
jgi:hypothetical protein